MRDRVWVVGGCAKQRRFNVNSYPWSKQAGVVRIVVKVIGRWVISPCLPTYLDAALLACVRVCYASRIGGLSGKEARWVL